MSCLLISGFRQSGKDYFYHSLKSGRCITDLYDIYVNEDSRISCLEVLAQKPEKYRRVAFADALKSNLAEMFGMTAEELDKLKTSRMTLEHIDKYPGKLLTTSVYRDAMIHLGLYMRSHVGNWYWAALAAERVKLEEDEIPVITDFRFPSELQYGEYVQRRPVTLRVHRAVVEIPPEDDESEHSLDMFPFDLVAIPRGERLNMSNNVVYHRINN